METNKLSVEGIEPAVGDGLLYIGGKWERIAPSMESIALDRLMQENESLKHDIERHMAIANEYMRENELLKKRIQELENG